MPARVLLSMAMFLGSTPLLLAQAAEPKAELPRVVLIGDSIRLGYAPLVAKRLEGKAVIVSVKDNGGDSANVLKHLDDWAVSTKPTVIHFNCGLHDLKLNKKTKQHQVELEQYEANLKQIVERLRKDTTAALVFANTTPIIDERHAKRKADFDRLEADVQRYNKSALAVMQRAGVPVHDLHWVVEQNDAEKLLGNDGTHYTAAGYERLAEAVADCVLRQLIIVQYKASKAPASGAEAGAEYRKAEKERDAQVPDAFKKFKVPDFTPPASAAAWKERRPEF